MSRSVYSLSNNQKYHQSRDPKLLSTLRLHSVATPICLTLQGLEVLCLREVVVLFAQLRVPVGRFEGHSDAPKA